MRILNTAERRKEREQQRVLGERITIPEFEIVSCPTVRLSEVRLRRFDVIERMRSYVAEAMRQACERTIFEEGEAIPAAVLPTIHREP